MNSSSSRARTFPDAKAQGSILIVAMIFGAIIAISLTTYLKLATTALNLSQRSFLANDSMNLTEAGLEQALWAFNQSTSGNTTVWTSSLTNAVPSTGWTITGNNATRTFTGFTFAQGATGSVKVQIENYNSSGSPAPSVVAQGIVQPAQGGNSTITKMVEVELIRRSLFANGMVGRNGITFSGNNASVDSWNSNPTNAAAGTYTPVAYDSTVDHDAGTIATVAITANISVQNADIWGYASVGGNSTTAIQVGSKGVVGPFGTTPGTKDPSRIAANFTDNLPNATNPTVPTGYVVPNITAINSALTLPRTSSPTDAPASDGVYYYTVDGISLSGASGTDLTISANRNVVIMINGSGSVTTTGNGGIVLSSGATLALYTAGDVAIGGNGILNGGDTLATAGQPSNFQIWGTATTAGSQSIAIAGNGVLSAIAYAPNATVTINGDGAVLGAVVGNTVKVTGNAAFHYDESLANWGGSNPFQISKWREIVSKTDRDTYASRLNF